MAGGLAPLFLLPLIIKMEQEKQLKEIEIEAKIKSLESELIELKTLPTKFWTTFSIGINRMETSLKKRLIELREEKKSLNINKASLEVEDEN